MAEQHRPEEEDEALDQTSVEIEKLEEDVKLMAQKIAEFRKTLPDHLQNTLASILSSQNPLTLSHSDNYHEPSSSNLNPDTGSLLEDDPSNAEKIQRIKQKISSNASAMPLLLKRMKDCMSRINKLNSFNIGVHPAFKRRKIASKDCFM